MYSDIWHLFLRAIPQARHITPPQHKLAAIKLAYQSGDHVLGDRLTRQLKAELEQLADAMNHRNAASSSAASAYGLSDVR